MGYKIGISVLGIWISVIGLTRLNQSQTNVVLLDSGKPNSAVVVSNNKGSQKIDKTNNFVSLKDKKTAPSEPKMMSEEEIHKRFANALSAAPKKPISHILYFKPHSSLLTDESKIVFQQALEDIKKSAPCVLDIIGHTDTVGSDELNIKVSLKRAKYVESLIRKEKISIASVLAKGYGEEDLLVPTADNINESKNRNVEIFIK